IQRSVPLMVALLVGGIALVGVFIVVDRRTAVSVLPQTAYSPGPFKWIYVTLGVLMAATMANMYVPLYGQRLAGLVPLTAGFLAVALSVGWTVSEIISASVTAPARVVRIVAVAPLVMAIGWGATALSQADSASPTVVGIWAVAMLVSGVGAGLAGIVVNTVDRPDAVGASWLFAVFAGLAALGCVASVRSGRGSQQAADASAV
ncbi:MFS transporter, partial [Mycobacterium sp. CBMA361]|nr:MFS transporter [Mycolicibacterium sp. CBMA 361]